jgi:site-specific recombinase XerD
VFCQTNGKPNFNRYFTQLLKKADLPHIRLHDCRHTYATLLLKHGVSPKVVQTLLGYSSVAITLDIYSHVSLELENKLRQS